MFAFPWMLVADASAELQNTQDHEWRVREEEDIRPFPKLTNKRLS